MVALAPPGESAAYTNPLTGSVATPAMKTPEGIGSGVVAHGAPAFGGHVVISNHDAARFSEIYALLPMKPIVPLAPRPSPVTATIPTVCVRGSPFGFVTCRMLASVRSVTYRLPSGPRAIPFGFRVRTSASGIIASGGPAMASLLGS